MQIGQVEINKAHRSAPWYLSSSALKCFDLLPIVPTIGMIVNQEHHRSKYSRKQTPGLKRYRGTIKYFQKIEISLRKVNWHNKIIFQVNKRWFCCE